MIEAFQGVVLYVALAGLSFLLPILFAKSKTILLAQERLLSYWRSLTPFGRIVALSFLTIGILYGGSKTNSSPRLTMMRPTPSIKMSYAERKAQNWNIRGACKDSFWLKFVDGWHFPCTTNHLRGVEVVSYGELWQTPFDDNAVASIGAPIEIVPTLSSFSYELTPSNSYRFVWENAAIPRNTNNLVTASLELFRNGDAFIVTNGVATYKERELPTEWGDPSEDDFYGNDNTLPSNADEDAYYWIDLVVSNATAKVLFAGDKPSNYPDPEFIAKYNETNRVYLLIGKKYTATSDEKITVVSKSSDDIIIDYISGKEIDIVLPVEFLVTNEDEVSNATSRAVTQVPIAGGFKIMPSPFLKGNYVWNSNEFCCITYSNKVNNVWHFSCKEACNCMGCSFNGTFHYEGYFLDVLDVSCGCSFVEEPSATASISFSKSAVIFENCYTNAPNDIVPRRSTTNSLDITIYGGPFGGIAEIDFDDNGKLEYLTSDAIPRSISVAAEQMVNLSFSFIGKKESVSENDIKASLKFTEYFTGDVTESDDEMTAVRVEVEPVVSVDTFLNRHNIGIGEQVICRVFPRVVQCYALYGDDGGKVDKYGEARFKGLYESSVRSLTFNFNSLGLFETKIVTVEPTGVVAIKASELKFDNEEINIAGWAGLLLELVVLPTNVSYSSISIMEVPEDPSSWISPTGYFMDNVFERIWHHTIDMGAGEWYRVQKGNFFLYDYAQCGEGLPSGWEEGQITWKIPTAWGYYSENNSGYVSKEFGNPYYQIFTMTSQGVLRVSKLGYWVERSPDGIHLRSENTEEGY